MQKRILLEANDLYLSKRYLKDYATLKTMEFWNKEMGVVKTIVDNETYFLYKSIPYRTRKKLLPADKIISDENKSAAHSKVTAILHEAYYYKYTIYKGIYENETSFTTGQITKFAQLHSVFQAIIDLKSNESFRHLIILHEAFNDLFPGKYRTKQAFSQAILKASVDGIMNVAMDKRVFGNNDRSKRTTTPQVDYIISALVSSSGKFTNAVMLEKANEYFKENKLQEMSLSWMKKQRREWLKNPEIYLSRYGQIQAQRQMPYASLKNATLTHIQWQLDGVTLPFWEAKFHRSTFVYVIDNCSKKIIGYAIGDSESSEVIKEALRNAVYSTGVLPFELVMDNHAFTHTQAALNFEALLKKAGSILTKTSNPRRKVIVERYIQNLNSLFKNYHGYLGKSIRSKSIEDIASDELKAEYAKKFKTKDEVVATVIQVIEEYNSKAQNGKIPNHVFNDNQHPHPIFLNEFNRAELLPNQLLKLVRNAQITIMRGLEKFEYQLPAHLYQQWNNQKVLVTHDDDLQNGIYLFNPDNGEGVIHLKLKTKINNAMALQSHGDLEALNKNSGRLKGIKIQSRKELENLTENALNIDPEAYAGISAMVTPKNILKQLEQDSHVKSLTEESGVIVNELPREDQTFDIPAALKPKKKDSNPFSIVNNKIEMVDTSKLLDEDEGD